MTTTPFFYLSDDTMCGLGITTTQVTERIESLLRGQADNRVWAAPKSAIIAPDGRYMMATLAVSDHPAILAVKTVVLNPDNPKRGLPQINGMITLLHGDSGLPAAIVDGNWITGVRTAGLSAVAAKRLARPDSTIAAFVGCGVQAQSHLEAFAELFPLKEVRAFGRGTANRDALCQRAADMGLHPVASPDAQSAVSDADLIITSVTYSPQLVPFLNAHWLKPGAFAAVTDLGAPWIKEDTTAFDRIVIDDLEQEATMPYPLAPPELVRGDLLGLISDPALARQTSEERTAFMFRGMALGDLALAGLVYEKACEAGVGTPINT
ncbi:MAG: ornithine cyclodeaminase family protein [Pseudomonadota bacterium]